MGLWENIKAPKKVSFLLKAIICIDTVGGDNQKETLFIIVNRRMLAHNVVTRACSKIRLHSERSKQDAVSAHLMPAAELCWQLRFVVLPC